MIRHMRSFVTLNNEDLGLELAYESVLQPIRAQLSMQLCVMSIDVCTQVP